MPRYKSHKEVQAAKIVSITPDVPVPVDPAKPGEVPVPAVPLGATLVTDAGPIKVDAAFLAKHKPEVGSYLVVYADGYQSISPAKAFEEGYSRIG